MRNVLYATPAAIALCAMLGGHRLLAQGPLGEEFFEGESCLQCHRFNGRGGTVASDLGKRIGRNYTPGAMTSLLWNHAPRMWEAMRQRGIGWKELTEGQSIEMFAMLYTLRFFDRMGDAGRGKNMFVTNRCTRCHGISESPSPGALPVTGWKSLGDPVALAQEMWNHGWDPRAASGLKIGSRPPLTPGGLTDMLVYWQNQPEVRRQSINYTLTLTAGRQPAPDTAGCGHTQCHGNEGRLSGLTLTDVAVAMWNHKPQATRPRLVRGEMQQFVSEIWANQFFLERGDPKRGEHVFARKNCAACHADPWSGAIDFRDRPRPHSTISMVSDLWRHGPGMLDLMKQRNLQWPRFGATDLTDLIAYLNTLPGVGPARPLLLRSGISGLLSTPSTGELAAW